MNCPYSNRPSSAGNRSRMIGKKQRYAIIGEGHLDSKLSGPNLPAWVAPAKVKVLPAESHEIGEIQQDHDVLRTAWTRDQAIYQLPTFPHLMHAAPLSRTKPSFLIRSVAMRFT